MNRPAKDPTEAKDAPRPGPPRLGSDSIRMRVRCIGSGQVRRGLGPTGWCQRSRDRILTVLLGLLSAAPVAAEGTTETTTLPDPPARKAAPRVGPASFTPSWDLDGFYLWLGPSGAASHIDATWDSTIGADLAFVRVREHAPLGVIGAALGGSRWTERGGGRIWLDALAGTRVLGRMVGVSAGPILELSDLAHPRVGVSGGLWLFAGITPFVRAGTVHELGTFGEIGIHVALPVYRSGR